MTKTNAFTPQKLSSTFRKFIESEAAGGIVLMIVAILAVIVANSALEPTYAKALHSYVGGLNVLHWINDGLMALFFLLVGLEIKREIVDGQLSTWSSRALPGLAALGGMIVPAVIYAAFNAESPETLKGWAIPAATDIAFALGVLSLLGSRVPLSLKVFLTALAILDDLGAVLLIALFYTTDLNLYALLGASAVTAILVVLNRTGVRILSPYLILGIGLWYLVLLSGIHATLAGVVLAMTIPLRGDSFGRSPPLLRLEHAIRRWVAFAVVPIFGFANAGVSFAGFSASALLGAVPLGIAAGLFAGKQIGVFGMTLLAIKAGWATLPEGATWRQTYAVSILCGIGFTMSLFIGLLAFPDAPHLQDEVKLGVLMGSVLSGIVGALLIGISPGLRRNKS